MSSGTKPDCMNPDCKHGNPTSVSCGLCRHCYGRLHYWVKRTEHLTGRAKITWKKLAAKNICLEPQNAARVAMSRK